MEPVRLHDKEEIEQFLRRDTRLHIYEIGDLDDFFWPHTIWYALKQGDVIVHLALLYTAVNPPVLLCFTDQNPDALSDWYQALIPLLPNQVYTHLSPGIPGFFQDHFQRLSCESMCKMALTHPEKPALIDASRAAPLGPSDLDDLLELYQTSYPGNFFDPRMLETGCFFGVRRSGRLVSVAGIHVYSPTYKVAALGNVATHPDYRRQGLALAACAGLCQFLLERVDHVGLNVNRDNLKAISLYERLGFTVWAPYEEAAYEKRPSNQKGA